MLKGGYDAKSSEKRQQIKTMQAKAKYEAEMAVYNAAAQYDKNLQEYQTKKAQYDKDKAAYDQLAKKAEEDAAKAQYEADLAKYNVRKSTVQKMIILLIKRNWLNTKLPKNNIRT